MTTTALRRSLAAAAVVTSIGAAGLAGAPAASAQSDPPEDCKYSASLVNAVKFFTCQVERLIAPLE